MKKEIIYPEATPVVKNQWNRDALESLQSLERYTFLKAINEGQNFVKRVMELADQAIVNGVITKAVVKDAINKALAEEESKKKSL